MSNTINICMKIILNILSALLLWIILLGILDYDTIVYTYNPIILIVGIVIYISLIKIIYKKLLPKIENNKIIPIILIRNIYYTLYYSWTSTKSKSYMGYGKGI